MLADGSAELAVLLLAREFRRGFALDLTNGQAKEGEVIIVQSLVNYVLLMSVLNAGSVVVGEFLIAEVAYGALVPTVDEDLGPDVTMVLELGAPALALVTGEATPVLEESVAE